MKSSAPPFASDARPDAPQEAPDQVRGAPAAASGAGSAEPGDLPDGPETPSSPAPSATPPTRGAPPPEPAPPSPPAAAPPATEKDSVRAGKVRDADPKSAPSGPEKNGNTALSGRPDPARPDGAAPTDPAEGFDLDAFLPYQLARLAASLSRDLAALYGARHGLTIPEWRVLAHLSQADAVSIRDIHARVDLDKAAVSRAARRLADAGLVSRAEAPDRRLVALSLTRQGHDLMAEIVPLALAREAEALAVLDPAERETFRVLLARLLAARG